MKTISVIILALSLVVTGCETPEGGSKQKAVNPNNEQKPELGMTKAEALARYGKTDNIAQSSRGEVWTYHLNMGEAFIPYNFGYRPKLRILTFDADGKLINWSYSK